MLFIAMPVLKSATFCESCFVVRFSVHEALVLYSAFLTRDASAVIVDSSATESLFVDWENLSAAARAFLSLLSLLLYVCSAIRQSDRAWA